MSLRVISFLILSLRANFSQCGNFIFCSKLSFPFLKTKNEKPKISLTYSHFHIFARNEVTKQSHQFIPTLFFLQSLIYHHFICFALSTLLPTLFIFSKNQKLLTKNFKHQRPTTTFTYSHVFLQNTNDIFDVRFFQHGIPIEYPALKILD